MKKYGYSTNEEDYDGDFDSREEALLEFRCDNPDDTVFTGEQVPASDYLRKNAKGFADSVIEQMDELIHGECGGDDAAFWLSSPLTEELGKLMVEFVAEHATFNRWGVTNIERHDV